VGKPQKSKARSGAAGKTSTKSTKSAVSAKSPSIPIAYKCGVTYFCETPFYVNKDVLIPRFDTEVLVEMVLLHDSSKRQSILDICTGSGCIAIVLAKHDHEVTATDISRKALGVARRNAKLNDVNVNFVHCDLFPRGGMFDVITCNPPYIKTADIGKHDPSTLYEPRIALDGGVDGLDFYVRIARNAGGWLKSGGTLYLEICHEIANSVKELLTVNGFEDIQVVEDRQGHDRVIKASKK